MRAGLLTELHRGDRRAILDRAGEPADCAVEKEE